MDISELVWHRHVSSEQGNQPNEVAADEVAAESKHWDEEREYQQVFSEKEETYIMGQCYHKGPSPTRDA